MAAAVSTTGTFLSSVRPLRRAGTQEEHGLWRLPMNHIADLRDIARGVEESDAGLCCKYLIDSMSGAGSDYKDVMLEDVENFCEQHHVWQHSVVASWRDRIKRSRRTLQRMHLAGHSKYVSVLHVVYGYPDPMTRDFPKKVRDAFDNLVGLMRYTDIVEVHRQEMARIEATEVSMRIAKSASAKDRPVHWKKSDDEIEGVTDPRFQHGDEVTRVAIRQNLPVNGAPFLIDVMKHREQYDRALRIISSGDALRAMLASVSPQRDDENDEQFDARKANHEAKQDLFVVQAKIESSKMLEIASITYHNTWLQSAT